MKTAIWSAILWGFAAAPAFAEDLTKEDVIKLAKAGLSDELIITFVDSKDATFDLTASDIVSLKEGTVSERVIAHLLTAAAKPPPAKPGDKADKKGAEPKEKPPLPPVRLDRDSPRTSYVPYTGPIYIRRYCYPDLYAWCYRRHHHGGCRH